MKVKLTLAAALTILSAGSTLAQHHMIAPGMNAQQVRGIFGAPARTRDAGEWSYWFYSNGCPNRCGSDDVVFFRNGQVVTAVLRSRARAISGPAAADVLDDEGGVPNADAIRAQAAPAQGPAPRPSGDRIIVRGRSRDRNGTGEQPPAEVGGISVESRPGTAGQVRDVAPVPRSGSNLSRDNADVGAGQTTIIRSGSPQGLTRGGGVTTPGAATRTQTGNGPTVTGPGPITAGAQPPANLTDTTGTARATAVDDERVSRESKVTRTTVPNQPDTIQSRRRDRENSVTPRVVPRP
ncbi:MAG TPA: hypothetical protein VF092_30655 [Longimicrobium sp.]